jgi:hypothetical protein
MVYIPERDWICSRIPIVPKAKWICFRERTYSNDIHSVLSSQEESRSISETVTWGQRKRFADGKVSLHYKRFLGYEKGEDGLPKIVESQAVVVRLIYKLFLEGKTPSNIAKLLTEQGISTPSGKARWPPSTVQSILTNEKCTLTNCSGRRASNSIK